MKFPSAVAAMLLTLTAVTARADTEEHKAVQAAAHRAQYDRARFICLSRGATMDAYEKVQPTAVIESQAALKAKYPEFWAVGAAQGARDADDHMRYVSPDILEKECAYIQSRALELTPAP